MLEPILVAARGRIIAGVLGGAAGVVVIVLLVLALTPRAGGGTVLVPDETPAPRWAPPADPPVAAVTPGPYGIAGLAEPAWVARTAKATGIPRRALAAYAGAAMTKASAMPACGLSWTTLAGIGRVESDHGRHGGSTIGADGTATPPIFGPALDGDGVARIPDSDQGAIDGDTKADRAVGPMQLIPQTWRNWHTDANADGREDPQNIDDAVMASANYLCRASTGLDTEAGWRRAITSYNDATTYIDAVARAAEGYRTAADR
ncbi:lytic murein transglycosylase [Pseudolysinimonas kribbensis]|uniref:Murein transglycosylase n=1 Tax=Pseudolysinimonas kribbensis TaxID=433641 RepID=A0ABQ6K2D6_9MICO|nr:lytic murein transglycosylase [Pseudolysinimonas kribbensis]GMA94782.1 murein transglycosylase [Pseudolysinimonas kribbensis]